MAGLPNRPVKLEVESSVEAADPDLDSDNPFIHHDAAASGSVNNSRRSASDQVNHLQNKIQHQTRYFTAKIRQLESQLQQSKNELGALRQQLPARLLQAKRQGESEERQKTIADLAANSEFERRAHDTLVQSHLEQLQHARFEAYDKGYSDGRDASRSDQRLEAQQEEEKDSDAEQQVPDRNQNTNGDVRDVNMRSGRSSHPSSFFPDDVLEEYYSSREKGQRSRALTTIYENWRKYYTDALPSRILQDDELGVDVLVLLAELSEKTTNDQALKLLLGEIASRNRGRSGLNLETKLTKVDVQNVLGRLAAEGAPSPSPQFLTAFPPRRSLSTTSSGQLSTRDNLSRDRKHNIALSDATPRSPKRSR